MFERDPQINLPNVGTDIIRARYYRENLDVALREGVAEFVDTAVSYMVCGKNWRVHKNANVYIDTTVRCPFNCGFCIAKTTDGRDGDIEASFVEDAISKLASSGMGFTCQVTGGEPSIHNDLYRILNLCGNRKTVINTNLPDDVMSAFDHINVSAHHYNRNIEETIMGASRSRTAIQRLSALTKQKIRLQCNLIGGYIDTFGEIMQYVAWGYHALGITNFAFSFLTELPSNNMYSADIISYVKDRPCVSFGEIAAEFEKRDHFQFQKYRGGVACYYEIWKFVAYEHPVTILLKYSNNHILHEIDDVPDLVPDIILHPNNTMTASWDARIKRML